MVKKKRKKSLQMEILGDSISRAEKAFDVVDELFGVKKKKKNNPKRRRY